MSIEVEKRADQGRKEAVKPTRPYRRWTREDKKVLTRIFPKSTNPDVAAEMGRSISSTIAQAFKLRLKKNPSVHTEIGRQNIEKQWMVVRKQPATKGKK